MASYRGSLNDGKLVLAECGISEEEEAIANVVRSAEGLEAAIAAGRLLIFVPGTADWLSHMGRLAQLASQPA